MNKYAEKFLLLFLLCVQCGLFLNGQSSGYKDWFAFKPGEMSADAVLNMSAWLDAPAGKHGFLTMKGKDYIFEDGTPIKFWGVNIASRLPFMEKEKVGAWVRVLSSYGINSVRFHKFTWDATDNIHSTLITPQKWERLDYLQSALKKAGIYYGWSHIYGHRVMPADSSRLLAYEEIKNTKFPWSHLNGTTASLVNFADDLQALNIELTVNMLNHVNPHTGLKNADDPGLGFIEMQNEDNIYWGAIEESLKQTPTYRKLLMQKFSRWLKKKYGTQAALEKAWNGQGLDHQATLDKEDIYPDPNHGLFSAEWEKAQANQSLLPMHIADRATFLFEEQWAFYQKFLRAIRETGYKGIVIGSCWQAGSGIAHFYNLYADYLTGAIDRHNYFGGGEGHSMHPGPFNNDAMVNSPGSGLLSTGLQQVADRPFQLSEWMSLIPNQWTAESAPLVAVYGMGLQGWDASYSFAMDQTGFTPTIQRGTGIYNVNSPTQLALYPALSAMVQRSDVREGEIVVQRMINPGELKTGRVSASDRMIQDHDRKSLIATVPNAMLALGRVALSFTGKDSSAVALSVAEDAVKGTTIQSNTGQLEWHTGDHGFFTVNTPGTKAVVGFAGRQLASLGSVSIQTMDSFSVVFVSSMEKGKDLDHTRKALITTIGRAMNSGMRYSENNTKLLSVGQAPILLQPVRTMIDLSKRPGAQLHVLDHSGNRTGQTIRATGGKFLVDGKKYKAIYYEIEWP